MGFDDEMAANGLYRQLRDACNDIGMPVLTGDTHCVLTSMNRNDFGMPVGTGNTWVDVPVTKLWVNAFC